MWGQGYRRDLGHTFWTQDCRGPSLAHAHGDHVGANYSKHDDCPCKDCGLTPNRWSQMVHVEDDQPLQLPQMTPPFMEPGLAKGEYGEAPKRGGRSS